VLTVDLLACPAKASRSAAKRPTLSSTSLAATATVDTSAITPLSVAEEKMSYTLNSSEACNLFFCIEDEAYMFTNLFHTNYFNFFA